MALTPQQMLEKYLEAEAALLDGKSIQWQGRTLTRENLDVIIRGRKEWERRVALESRPSRHSLVRFH